MSALPFTGTATAVVTPMRDGKIDLDSFSRLLEMQADNGINAVVICGTTGESPTLTEDEKITLFSFASKNYGKRLRIIAGCGSPSTESTVRLAQKAEASGANAILTVTPYYNKCTPKGLYLHYKTVADRVSLPVIAYNVPPRTGMDIPMEAYEAMASIDNLCGVKEASGNVAKTEQILSHFGDRFAIYSGCDELIAPMYAVGAKGVVSVVSNILPGETEELCRLLSKDKLSDAARLQVKMYPIIRALFSEVSPIPIKYALSLMGICRCEMRLPLCPPSEETQRRIEKALQDFIK
ncbi:MAG: 4-hydroxy-tetrahydrodipicolinate synthase [Clostridia bacterium]|nr:4-hydroxy-tetrahydrodipicolinate synthase [Clostridia bacterium]